ncbi:hypothetical protein ACTXT7_005841 [Hymenolepis weldensis]
MAMDSIETVKTAAIVRRIMEQINSSKPDKDTKDYVKNVGEFHYEPSKFNKSDHMAYLVPLSPTDLRFEEAIQKCEKIIGDNTSLFNRRYKCLNLTKHEDEDRGIDFVAIFTSIRIVLSLNVSVRTAIRTETRKDSARAINDDRTQATGEAPIRLNIAKHTIILTMMQVNVSTRRCETLCINGIFLELQVDTGSDITTGSSKAWKTLGSPNALGDAAQLLTAMKCEAAFTGKTAATVYYVVDRDINFLELDWIDMLNVL